MKKTSTHYTCTLLLMAVMIIGCTKVEKGPKGDPGTAGKQPLVESEVVTVLSTNWKKSADTLELETTIVLPKLTQAIIDKGSVQLFVMKDNQWAAVPYMESDKFIIFSYEVGEVHLIYGSSHHIRPAIPPTGYYKVVLLSNP